MGKQQASHGNKGDSGYDIVHARMLEQFPELVAELADDVANGDMRAADSETAIGKGAAAVTYRDFVTLLASAAERFSCPDFGMRLAARQNGGGMFGPLGQVMQNSRNFGEALTYVSEHTYAHSLAARVWLKRMEAGSRVFSGHDILLGGVARREQAIEHIMLVGHLTAMELTGGRARARIVHFRHEPVSSLRTYRRYFGCDVRFGQAADGVTFHDTDLAAPIVAPDEQAFAEITAFIERRFTQRQPPFHAQARAVMLRLLATGNCSTDQVASALCIHLRTLHRRLREEDTSYRQLKHEVRRDLLRYYLERTDFDLGIISEKLGFAEQSVMSRYCRRWFASSPSAVRRQLA